MMTDHLAMTPTDRRKKIRLLQELGVRLKASGDMNAHGVGRGDMGFKLWDEAHAIRWALNCVARYCDLETGKLTISLEPEEVA